MRFKYATFTLGRQLKRVRRLPASVRLSLRGLRAGTQRLTVRAYFTETLAVAAKRGTKRNARQRRLKVTVSKRLISSFRIC